MTQHIIIIIAITVALIAPEHTMSYGHNEYKWQEFGRTGACTWDECPDEIVEQMLEDNNGLKPPSAYKEDSKEYWRSFCTYMPERCK